MADLIRQDVTAAAIQTYLDSCQLPWIVIEAKFGCHGDVTYLRTMIVVRQYNYCDYPWVVTSSTKAESENITDSYLRLLVEGTKRHMAGKVERE